MSSATFGLPMTRRLTENSAIIVRIEASRLRILKRTFSIAVTRPAQRRPTIATQGRQPGIDAGDDQHRRDGSAERKGAVDRQVRKIQHAEGEVDPDRDEGIDQPQLDGTPEGDLAHGSWLLFARSASSAETLRSTAPGDPAAADRRSQVSGEPIYSMTLWRAPDDALPAG